MPQQSIVAVENSFIHGLVTEATGLNFPESACTDTDNCEFDLDGSVTRREGFDLEANYSPKVINRSNVAINSYLWQNVAGDGNTTVVVVQVGNKLYFYETTGTGNFSLGAQATTVTLTAVSGAPLVETVEAQFCDGNGYLFVTHPYIDPVRISYDATAHTATAVSMILQIRDLEGALADVLATDARPTSTLAGLEVNHAYNLYNQGWTTANLTAWDTAQTTMPSNADVMWQFVDSSGNPDFTTPSLTRITAGNTPAPRGHFILNLSNQDRSTASGLVGLTATTTSFQRPSLAAFFAGRVFYAGINAAGFNSNIYFTQIVERTAQYSQCYQLNDPTSEKLFDILPSDGGFINIPEAGSIYKLFVVSGGLAVFAANGIWFITGSTGIGFTASDYAVIKVADISAISATSFVNISGSPAWWNSEGIYIMVANQNLPTVESLTFNNFKTFYSEIPLTSKRYARGFYNKTDGHIRWLYRSTSTTQLTNTYEYDKILNFNTRTQAFYPWTIASSPVKVNGIISSELITKPVQLNNVIDHLGNQVIDAATETVISFTESGSDSAQFDKFLVSYSNGAGSYNFTFADRHNTNFVDWKTYDGIGVNYDSYLVTGYKLRGQAIRKFQNNYINIYSRLDTPVQYNFQGIWDFANTGSGTGRWSSLQQVSHTDLDYDTATKRLKVRGHGKSLQFKVSSVQGQPFDIIGWSSQQTINATP